MAKVTGLSGNEIYCLALKQYSAGELVVGNSALRGETSDGRLDFSTPEQDAATQVWAAVSPCPAAMKTSKTSRQVRFWSRIHWRTVVPSTNSMARNREPLSLPASWICTM